MEQELCKTILPELESQDMIQQGQGNNMHCLDELLQNTQQWLSPFPFSND